MHHPTGSQIMHCGENAAHPINVSCGLCDLAAVVCSLQKKKRSHPAAKIRNRLNFWRNAPRHQAAMANHISCDQTGWPTALLFEPFTLNL